MSQNWIRSIIAASAIACAVPCTASPITVDFVVKGFSNNGVIHGSFTGEDLNNDGYLSSFIYSGRDSDFENTPFTPGLNEITHASAQFEGSFEAATSEDSGINTITSVSFSNDLTDFNDGFPLDLFFVLNYEIGSRFIGDNEFEGLLFGESNQPFIFGLGQFLPVPANIQLFDTPGVDEGSTLTNSLIRTSANGEPCIVGATCGVIHTVFLDTTTPEPFDVVNGGFDLTSALGEVKVPTGAINALFALSLLVVLFPRKEILRRSV